MTNFGAMNDSYYQPNYDPMWDHFVDYCEENDLDPSVEDYDSWVEERIEEAEERAAEMAYEAHREREWDY